MEQRQDTSRRRARESPDRGDEGSGYGHARAIIRDAERRQEDNRVKRPRVVGEFESMGDGIIEHGGAGPSKHDAPIPTRVSPATQASAPIAPPTEDTQELPEDNGAAWLGEQEAQASLTSSMINEQGTQPRELPEPFRLSKQQEESFSLPARVGGWIVPDEPEIWEERKVGIDPNGDDDAVASYVQSLLTAPPPKAVESAPAAPSPSQPEEGTKATVEHTALSQPVVSTPPQGRRSRRSAATFSSQSMDEASASRLLNGVSQHDETQNTGMKFRAALADISLVVASPHDKTSVRHIARLMEASPLVPTFLKPEIVQFLDRHPGQGESQGHSGTESETQEDGYLFTKATWVFELCKIVKDEEAIGGDDLLSDVSTDFDAIVLIVQCRAGSSGQYTVERASQEQLLAWRANIQTNVWFDASGQPFAVTYRSPGLGDSSGSSRPSLLTQDASNETESLRRELETMTKAHQRLTEEYDVIRASNEATQEQLDLIRRLYDDASNLASQAEREAETLRRENISLRHQVAHSVQATQSLADERIARLQYDLKSVSQQRDLLVQQNELTNDEIRRKAGEWDVLEARRIQELKRKERAEAARLETHLALQATLLGNEFSRRPQDHLLAIDLAVQRKSLDEAGDGSGGGEASTSAAAFHDDDDELAALEKEAAQHGEDGLRVDAEGPRARRSRTRRSASRQQEPNLDAIDEDVDELTALRQEAVAAGDDPSTLAVPADGSRSTRRTSSRRGGSQTRATTAATDTENGTPTPKLKDLSLPSSPYLATRRRARSRPAPSAEDVDEMALVIASGQTEAQDAASYALEAEFAALDDARAIGSAADGEYDEVM